MEAPYHGLLIDHIFFFNLQDLGKKRFEERKVCYKKKLFPYASDLSLPLFMLHQLLVLVYPRIEFKKKNSEKQDGGICFTK